MATWGDILRAISDKLEKQRQEIADHMLTGKCSSFEDYKKQVGIGEGLARAQKEIKDSMKRLHNADD